MSLTNCCIKLDHYTVYPKAAVKLCMVHMVRNSLNFVGWSKREEVAIHLKRVDMAATEAEAKQHLAAFELKWDQTYPPIGQS